MNIKLPLPSLRAQHQVAGILARQIALKERHTAIRAANDALIPAALERIFQPVGA